jgi:4'-phosphopantetheinyl transferase
VRVIETVVRVWQVPLDRPPGEVEQAWALLAADERERAARIVFERDRVRYVVARAGLRRILGRWLGVEPASLRFTYSPAGKPALDPTGLNGPPPQFNLAHSHDLALVAVTPEVAIGVDLEYAREAADLAAIAGRFFAPSEAAQLLALPVAEQPAAFHRCWTRKEAYLKARGDGISGGLARFEVTLLPGEAPALLRTLDDPLEAACWTLADPPVPAGYTAALAVRATSVRVENDVAN